ncbi:MAG: hypothetical protein HYW71_02585 [Candidatus Niyogibacteria bacterium]|nr:hypothetical protein [Candidatus Niyogibacteria bacterium]
MKSNPSQQLIPISEIRDDVVILKDGSFRMILMASSINFSLKSLEEQKAIISQYQYFLNTLDFSVQFLIHSASLDINPYLTMLKEKEKTQTNELLKIQTREYSEFIKNFIETNKIMSKTFYVAVSYTAAVVPAAGGLLESFKKLTGQKEKSSESEEKFLEHKNQLWQRIDAVTEGLARCGVRTVPLKTEELIELFYQLYNPGETAEGIALKT